MDEPLVNVKHTVGVVVLDDKRPSNDILTLVLDKIILAVAPRNRKIVEEVKSDLLRSSNNSKNIRK